MLAAFDPFEYLEAAVVAESDLIDALKLVGDAKALADDLNLEGKSASG